MSIKNYRVLLLAGFFGPIVFALVIFLSGLMYPGYDHVNQVISDLGAVGSPVKDFMNLSGFMLFGIFILAFSIGVYGTRDSRVGKIISALFAVAGIGIFLIGIFPSDPPCMQGPRFCPPPTFIGEIHSVASFAPYFFFFPAFILLIIDVNLLRREESMKYYFIPAAMLGLITAYFAFSWANYQSPVLAGLTQRIAIGTPFLLLMYTSMKLYRIKPK